MLIINPYFGHEPPKLGFYFFTTKSLNDSNTICVKNRPYGPLELKSCTNIKNRGLEAFESLNFKD